jgi:hypothetical protein
MKINIPNPCPEKWSSMAPTEQGAFCKVCSKDLADLTKKTPAEIESYFAEKKDEEYTCAKLSVTQIFKMNFDDFFQRFRLWNLARRIAVVLFFVFGLGLFSCKAKKGKIVGKVAPTRTADTKIGLIEYNPGTDSTGKH